MPGLTSAHIVARNMFWGGIMLRLGFLLLAAYGVSLAFGASGLIHILPLLALGAFGIRLVQGQRRLRKADPDGHHPRRGVRTG